MSTRVIVEQENGVEIIFDIFGGLFAIFVVFPIRIIWFLITRIINRRRGRHRG